MEKFFKKFSCRPVLVTPKEPITPTINDPGSSNVKRPHLDSVEDPGSSNVKRPHLDSVEDPSSPSVKRRRVDEIDLSTLKADPGLRVPISDYDPNVRDMVRRAYLLKGPCQPDCDFEFVDFGQEKRRFNPQWYRQYGDWLEYSVSKKAVFCLYCYLFKGRRGSNNFVVNGFTNWKKGSERLQKHIGHVNSAHNKAYMDARNLLNQKQHIETTIIKQDEQSRLDYKFHLETSVKVIHLLLDLGLPFRGYDEKKNSNKKGNFLSVLEFLGENSEEVRNMLQKTNSHNDLLISPKIQKQIVSACAAETVDAILNDVGESFFAILVAESRDVSIKEQMVVALRYVDKRGCVKERIIGFLHVTETTSLSLKKAIDGLFSQHSLSTSKLRGQGYDGTSNMQGEFNGLKSLILKENKYAFYIHCFAHQLQLTVVAIAKNFRPISNFFDVLSETITLVGGSCKHKDALREFHLLSIVSSIESDEQVTVRGCKQETSLKRPTETRWGSYYDTLLRFIQMFSTVVDLLELVDEDGWFRENRAKAMSLRGVMGTFDFAFKLHMMENIMAITNDLSKVLQRKDQDIVNAMQLVKLCKRRFQVLRESGWDSLLLEVTSFCHVHDIDVPDMDDRFVAHRRSRRGEEITTQHHYQVELFYIIIDMQLSELQSRFSEVGTELLICMSCLSPANSFASFDKTKLLRLAELYDTDFTQFDILMLDDQLEMYILDMCSDDAYSRLKGISDLAKKMVETKKNIVYPLVYLLITFALILPVATDTVERAFSAMKLMESSLCNRMGDKWMSESLVTYIENDVFKSIDTEKIARRFHSMTSRRGQLPDP